MLQVECREEKEMIKTKELIERIGSVVGDNDTDEYLELLEYIRENNETEGDNEEWKRKYEENDKEWRRRYRERFFKKEDVEDDDEYKDEEEKKYTYEELFDESEEEK